MLRLSLMLFLLASCSLGVTSKDGQESHAYRNAEDYNLERLRELAPKVVTTSWRHPPVSTLDKLFAPSQPDLKRIGIVVFETNIQETRSGLASTTGKVYPTAAGKQLLTEEFLTIWDEALPIVFPEGEYVPVAQMKEAKALHQGGADVTDLIKSPRTTLAEGDLIYLEKGKATATETIVNARGMQDLSFVLVPASDLMNGPKWSEHQKYLINDVAKELKLDALIVVKSSISWEADHKEDLSGDHRPEEMQLTMTASTIVPMVRYHERLKLIGNSEEPLVTATYRTHQATLKLPVKINLPPEEQKFENIEKNLISPMIQSYRDLAVMTLIQMAHEWKKTF